MKEDGILFNGVRFDNIEDFMNILGRQINLSQMSLLAGSIFQATYHICTDIEQALLEMKPIAYHC